MINVPKGLAPHEVDLYISAFKFCEKLIQEQNTDIGAAVTETTEKYSFIISDKYCLTFGGALHVGSVLLLFCL